MQWYYQLAQRIADAAGVTPEDVNALIAAYIEEHPYPVVPADIITASNAAQNVVTSVNGEKGDVTVTGGGGVPDNVITTDNIADNAVTSFNGQHGAVNYTAPVTSVNGQTGEVTVPGGVTSVNGMTGPAVETAYSKDGYYVLTLTNNTALIIAYVSAQCLSQTPPVYAGVLANPGYTSIGFLVSAQFVNDPTPFVPNGMELETSEGVWSIKITGIASGQAVTVGDTRQVCIMATVWR